MTFRARGLNLRHGILKREDKQLRIRIRLGHRISVPMEIVGKLQVRIGDLVEVEVREGKRARVPIKG